MMLKVRCLDRNNFKAKIERVWYFGSLWLIFWYHTLALLELVCDYLFGSRFGCLWCFRGDEFASLWSSEDFVDYVDLNCVELDWVGLDLNSCLTTLMVWLIEVSQLKILGHRILAKFHHMLSIKLHKIPRVSWVYTFCVLINLFLQPPKTVNLWVFWGPE